MARKRTLDRRTLEDAVVSIWVRSIFATDPILEAR